MLIYPAIDLMDGVCVRLEQGRFDAQTSYDQDPLARLKSFAEAGASWVHVVDLDGAKAGAPRQYDLIGRLAAAGLANIQTGGGVRAKADVETLLSAGASAVVVGSAAVKHPDAVRSWIAEFGLDRITLALDVKPKAGGYEVVGHGWTAGSGLDLFEALALYPQGTAQRLLVTDVSRDGMLEGPNFALMTALLNARPDLQLQASGGVSGIEDLHKLAALGAHGAIVGKAIYEGRVALEEALLC